METGHLESPVRFAREVLSTGGAVMEHSKSHGRVASATPGRVRIRLHGPHRHLVHALREHLAKQIGVQEVTSNASTGSVLVRWDSKRISSDDILAMCRDIGVVVKGVTEAEADPLAEIGSSSTAESLISALDDLDRRVSQATGRAIDLKAIVPLLLGAVGVRQLIVDGFGSASGYILLWLAFDTFLKLHRRTAPLPATNGKVERQPAMASAVGVSSG